MHFKLKFFINYDKELCTHSYNCLTKTQNCHSIKLNQVDRVMYLIYSVQY